MGMRSSAPHAPQHGHAQQCPACDCDRPQEIEDDKEKPFQTATVGRCLPQVTTDDVCMRAH
eukprot:330386-Chlamydomonas_euryale.AAC.1